MNHVNSYHKTIRDKRDYGKNRHNFKNQQHREIFQS